MRVCHISRCLSPGQTAQALLPCLLGQLTAAAGHEVRFVAHAPADPSAWRTTDAGGEVTWLPPWPETASPGTLHPRTIRTAVTALRAVLPAVRWAELVHLHGDGLLTGVGALAASRLRRPTVMTVYGREIWDREPSRWRPDAFARAYRGAAHVAFYSHGLLNRATSIGFGRRDSTVVYPPAAAPFVHHDATARQSVRAELGIRSRHVIVSAKPLEPLSGQRHLLDALGEVIRTHPDTRLVLCGDGPMLAELRHAARGFGVEGHVTFTGVVDQPSLARYMSAADVFVLPSIVEAFPTTALEALACGTPVVSTDSPGGLELREIFGFDVCIVPGEQPLALAQAMLQLVDEKRRTRWSTADLIEREFRPPSVMAQYGAIYDRALGSAGTA